MPEYHDGGARLAHGDLTIAARALGWFEAEKSPNGWTYTLNPACHQPTPWPAWSRWLLEAVTIALIVSGVGLLGSYVATTSGSARDGKRVIFGLSGLAYLVGGGSDRSKADPAPDSPERRMAVLNHTVGCTLRGSSESRRRSQVL
jgi:hypothetical protein